MKFYAHSTSEVDKSNWQGLDDHLEAVGQLAADRAGWFGGEVMACATGMLHDLGKYTESFQARLTGAVPRVDHATWGADVARHRYKSLGSLMAYAIAGHHAELAMVSACETGAWTEHVCCKAVIQGAG